MKHLAIVLAAILLPPAAHAQPQELPAELVAYLDTIEMEMGVKRLGQTFFGVLEDDEETTHVVTIAPGKDTYIQIACGGFCETVFAEAKDSTGEIIARTQPNRIEPVLLIPAGTGDNVSVTVNMVLCDDFDCQYVVQAFAR